MIDLAVPTTRDELWSAIHAERADLVAQLEDLTAEQWATRSLCGAWTVEETVAHLSAAAGVGRLRWIASMVAARFDDGVHNRRRLDEQRGATPQETLAILRSRVDSTVEPIRMPAAWLGEVIVHGADVRRPLGLAGTTPVGRATAVARFFASRDVTVNGRSAIAGLRVDAVDGPFVTGDEGAPLVTGPTLALVMAMAAGRRSSTTSPDPGSRRCAHASVKHIDHIVKRIDYLCDRVAVQDHVATDLAVLVLRAATEVVDGVQEGLAARGFDDLRPVHGFAFARIASGDTTVVDLADHLGTSKQAASQLVAGLVARGYLVREPDPRDQRARLLRLTDRGAACTRAAEAAAADVVAGWGETLPGSSLAALHAMLRRVTSPGPLRPAW